MSIAAPLFSPAQMRLFPWLLEQPERRYYLKELLRLTGMGSASLQRELKRLVDAGPVCSERDGNVRRFQANPESPVYAELVGLVRKTLGAQPLLAGALAPLKPRLQAAWIYGSLAKQTDKAGSDLDLMIVADDLSLSEVLDAVLPLEPQLGRKINPTCYTHTEFERRRAEPDSFVNRVLAQPVLPLIGEAGEPSGAR